MIEYSEKYTSLFINSLYTSNGLVCRWAGLTVANHEHDENRQEYDDDTRDLHDAGRFGGYRHGVLNTIAWIAVGIAVVPQRACSDT